MSETYAGLKGDRLGGLPAIEHGIALPTGLHQRPDLRNSGELKLLRLTDAFARLPTR
jgi:hypothetical protein